MFVGLVGGVVSLAFAVAGITGGKHRPHYPSQAGTPVRYLESFALYLIGMIALSLAARVLRLHDLWPSFFLLLLPPLTLAWPMSKFGIRATGRDVGWWGNINVLREMLAGIVGYIAGMPILAAGQGL